MRKFTLGAGIVAIAVLLLVGSPVHASLIYDYTGNAFTEGTFTGNNVTATMVLDEAFVPPHYTGLVGLGSGIESLSLTALGQTLTDNTASLGYVLVAIEDGQIFGWLIELGGGNPAFSIATGFVSGSGYDQYLLTTSGEGGVVYTPGTWTLRGSSSVPEPCAAMLLISGLAGLAAVRKRIRVA
jgi:hypothetical protein